MSGFRKRQFHALSRIELVDSESLRTLLEVHSQRYRTWSAPEADVELKMNAASGPLVEVAGPSLGHKKPWFASTFIHDLEKLKRPVHASNITDNPYGSERVKTGRWPWQRRTIHAKDLVQFVADARQMPFKNGSLGAVFAAYLPGATDVAGLWSDFLFEAARVLEPGGHIVMHGARAIDIQEASGLGLDPVRLRGYQTKAMGGGWIQGFDFIAQKRPNDPPAP